MKSYTALILCAGFGKRLNPITLIKPKPLIEINNKNLLSRTLEFIEYLGIKEIKINTFYLSNQITNFIKNSNFKENVEIIHDGNEILDTGGGAKNMINYANQDNVIIFNPDTIWSQNYKSVVLEMINFYEKNNLNNLLLVVHKKYSFDKRFKGDFQLKGIKLSKEISNEFVYTGLQIINKDLFEKIKDRKFSMRNIWEKEINESNLNGYESCEKFIHLTDMEIYKNLIKK